MGVAGGVLVLMAKGSARSCITMVLNRLKIFWVFAAAAVALAFLMFSFPDGGYTRGGEVSWISCLPGALAERPVLGEQVRPVLLDVVAVLQTWFKPFEPRVPESSFATRARDEFRVRVAPTPSILPIDSISDYTRRLERFKPSERI